MTTSGARVLRLAVAVLLLGAVPGGAQVNDHLKCHRVKDKTKPNASADLVALQPDFSDTGCKIKGAKLFCVPVSKTNVSPAPPRPDIVGPALDVDFTCYTLSCPLIPPDKQVVDQFGFRQQTKYKTSLLCVPTEKFCYRTGGHTCGGGCPVAGQVCLPNPVDICTCQTTTTSTTVTTTTEPPTTTEPTTTTETTSTTTTTTPPSCVLSGFPVCNGPCPFPMVCEKDFPTQNCICCGLGGVSCNSNNDCCTQNCVGGVCS
jgi:hypothetical protein